MYVFVVTLIGDENLQINILNEEGRSELFASSEFETGKAIRDVSPKNILLSVHSVGVVIDAFRNNDWDIIGEVKDVWY